MNPALSQPVVDDTSISLQQLAGRWYIHYSNFPMWLKGNKLFPTFNYQLQQRQNKVGLADQVIYYKNNRQKTINGFDQAINAQNTQFIWQSDFLFGMIQSKWQILYFNDAEQLAIIHFEKSLFSPAGYDVISKHAQLSLAQQQLIHQQLEQLALTTPLIPIKQQAYGSN